MANPLAIIKNLLAPRGGGNGKETTPQVWGDGLPAGARTAMGGQHTGASASVEHEVRTMVETDRRGRVIRKWQEHFEAARDTHVVSGRNISVQAVGMARVDPNLPPQETVITSGSGGVFEFSGVSTYGIPLPQQHE